MLYGFKVNSIRQVLKSDYRFCTDPTIHPTRNLDYHDIFLVLDGCYYLRIGGEDHSFNCGDIAVLPAHHTHHGIYPCKKKSRQVFVHFSTDPGDTALEENTMIKPEASGQLSPEDMSITKISVTMSNSLFPQYFFELQKLFWSDLPNKDLRCSSLLNLIISEIADETSTLIKKKDPLILQIQTLFSENPHQFFSVDDLAQRVNLSPRTFSTRFKKATGQSAHHYQLSTKLNHIAAYLRTEHQSSLKELADSFGFCDEFHLSVAFKKKFGLSPRNYIKN